MKAKTPSESLTITTKIVLPNQTNPHGNLFGGQLLSWMDEVAVITAQRHSRRVVVTAAVNNVSFASPVKESDVVTLEARVSRVFNSSMEIFIDVYVERSEEHTSELQSRPHLVCRLLLEKKKKKKITLLKLKKK